MDNKPLPVAVADWTAEAVKMALCCATRKEPPNEYDQLRKALQRKQEEVRRLQEQVDALEKAPSPMPAASILSRGGGATVDSNGYS